MSKPATDWRDALGALLPEDFTAEEESSPAAADTPVDKAILHVEISRKGRGGKVATIVSGFSDSTSDDAIDELAAMLRRCLGTGGSARGGEILIQGERRDAVIAALKALGYKAK